MTKTIITSFPINAHQAKKLAKQLAVDFSPLQITTFDSGEFYIEAPELLTGKIVILFHHHLSPLHETMMQLILGINATRQRQPDKLILLMPYLPYSRQDRRHNPGAAIGANVMAQLLQIGTPDTFIFLDLHSPQIIDYFNVPVINLAATTLIAHDIQQRFSKSNIYLISPDDGSSARTQTIAEKLNIPYLSFTKERTGFHDLVIHDHRTDFQGKTCIFIDDMIDTGMTLLKAADTCHGASEIHVYATHGIFSHPILLRELGNRFNSLTVTDSIPQSEQLQNLRILPCWELFLAACPI